MNLSEDRTDGFCLLKSVLFFVCPVHNVYFQILVKQNMLEYEEMPSGSVDLVIENPHFNPREVRIDQNSSHNQLSTDGLKAVDK